MTQPPTYNIDPQAFWHDPYPDLANMRRDCPVAYVPQLDAILITRRDDIFREEKNVAVFSSDQPGGLMTTLMGQNMMRKDGDAHMAERRAIFPTVSPKTVRDHWTAQFRTACAQVLRDLAPKGACDLVADYAKPVAGHALCAMTGLTNMTWQEMDRVSQGMIDGCANYAGDPAIEANCHNCTASIDAHIDAQVPVLTAAPDLSMLSVLVRAEMPMEQIRANIKLAISGGQNEPRDAIAGTVWALLAHPDQLTLVQTGQATWLAAFEEFARWQSPIGMSPRRITQTHNVAGVTLQKDSRAFLMFGSGNRDAAAFSNPDAYDLTQDAARAISFGAGPHFCAGAWASKALIGDVALPMLFDALPGLRLNGAVPIGGWAFRGPLSVPVVWGGSA